MAEINPVEKALLLLRELGLTQLTENLIYRLQINSGWMERKTPPNQLCHAPFTIDFGREPFFFFDWLRSSRESKTYIEQADEIVSGQYRPFGDQLSALDFSLPQPLKHWTKYGDTLDGRDIKTYWEPARFIWTIPLCLAYKITKDEKYPETFWRFFSTFIEANPPNLGPNWSSAQEVALRLIPWTMAGQAFEKSQVSTKERKVLLADAIWQHCRRIPSSLNYARSQHNNHWLSEALGLMIGGVHFKDTNQGQYWLKTGIREFESALLTLIDDDGTFSQHSTNYHRMLLDLALIYWRILQIKKEDLAPEIKEKLTAATLWLIGQLDQLSGRVPNLGHNDGTNLLPVGSKDYSDFRPALQAASRAFLDVDLLAVGQWDDLSALFNLRTPTPALTLQVSSATHRIESEQTWASLRVCSFSSRPAHADLLHTELWKDGINLAMDPGTFAYNLPAPWQNALASTLVHNTITIDDCDQFLKAGKFLWLRRVNAQLIEKKDKSISAKIHVRQPVSYEQTRSIILKDPSYFEVTDAIKFSGKESKPIKVSIQWLLPDWKYQLKENALEMANGKNRIHLELFAISEHAQSIPGSVSLIRGGETLIGNCVNPIRGWVSKTYLSKDPSLSLAVEFVTEEDLQIKSIWKLQ